jgi:hypothetical protein
MIDFNAMLESQTRSLTVKTAVPTVVERVTITPRPAEVPTAYLAQPAEKWSWEDLRNYVIDQIQKYHGPQLRNPITEAAIFKGFLARHGANSARIAKQAFSERGEKGMWVSAPISVNRFCKNQDPFFALPILAKLDA